MSVSGWIVALFGGANLGYGLLMLAEGNFIAALNFAIFAGAVYQNAAEVAERVGSKR